jgi:hypothetical protein
MKGFLGFAIAEFILGQSPGVRDDKNKDIPFRKVNTL